LISVFPLSLNQAFKFLFVYFGVFALTKFS